MVIFINEIARNNPNDKLSSRSLNNQEGSHMSNKPVRKSNTNNKKKGSN